MFNRYELSRNPDVREFEYSIDGYTVPFIKGFKHGENDKVTLCLYRHGFPYLQIDVNDSTVETMMHFLANSMAVAAGYSSFGPNSNIMNPFGPGPSVFTATYKPTEPIKMEENLNV